MQKKFVVPQNKPDIAESEIKAVLKVLRSGWPTQGKVTKQFEALLANYFSSNVVAVNNGSSALLATLLAHGIKLGDKVIVPALSFLAPASISKILGAKLIVADINRHTFNIAPETVEKLLKKNKDVKAVIVVDVAGLPVDIDAFTELSQRFGFVLIEDAAEALGAEYKHKKIGSFDHTTIFSFQITKQLTTIEGGCISTRDKVIAKKCCQIRNYGRDENVSYVHQVLGLNLRITDLQSSMGIVQFKKLESYLCGRNEVALEYKRKIKGIEFQTVPSYVTRHSYWMFLGVAQDKAEKDMHVSRLNGEGIEARGVWTPIHMQPCFPELNNVNCQNADYVFDRAFSLPIFNAMLPTDVAKVIDAF